MAETLSFPYETSILIMGTGCFTDSFSHRDFIFNIFYCAGPCNAGPFFSLLTQNQNGKND